MPIPILEVAPSTVSTVVVVPPSLTLIEMSVSCVAFVRLTPVASTVKSKSLSAPTVRPESLTTPSVPDVVSLAFDLRKLPTAIPPSLSASVAVPVNFMSAIAVERVIPFVIVAKPDIPVSYTHLRAHET